MRTIEIEFASTNRNENSSTYISEVATFNLPLIIYVYFRAATAWFSIFTRFRVFSCTPAFLCSATQSRWKLGGRGGWGAAGAGGQWGQRRSLTYILADQWTRCPPHYYIPRTRDTQWRHKSKKSEILGRCGRQNMLRPYLKIWDWDLIFGRALKAISSPDVRSPCYILALTNFQTFLRPYF